MTKPIFLIKNNGMLAPQSLENEWREELLHSYSHVADLLKANLITTSESRRLEGIGKKFKIRITPYYASLMENNPNCPIRRQAIPDLGEEDPALPVWASKISDEIYQNSVPWKADAIGDLTHLAAPRLTHRYEDRAILHLSSLCAVYCRFCFRKAHLNDQERTLYEGSLDPTLEYLSRNPGIHELILTGGDPLSISDQALGRLFEKIATIPHIRTVRLHSRMTVTLPSRLTPTLLDLFYKDWGFHLLMASHFNHPKELSPQARKSLVALRKTGVTLLNQTVLLKGVNASIDCLRTLFSELYQTGVIPFYLHHPDWTPGTFQFRTSIQKGQELMTALRGLLPGPALPHYVLDIPSGFGKTSILDPRFRKVKDLADPPGEKPSGIQGALYEIPTPHTRAKDLTNRLYLDLFPA